MTIVLTTVGLYWPQLRNEARTLDAALDNYISWVLEAGSLRVKASPQVVPPAHLAKATDVYPPVLRARKALIAQAEFLHEYG